MERSKIKIVGSLVLSSLILLGSVWASPAEARGFKRAHNRAQQVRGHKQRPSYRNHYRTQRRVKQYRKAHRRAYHRNRAFNKNHYGRASKMRQRRMRQYRMKRYRMRHHRREVLSDRREFRRAGRGFKRDRSELGGDAPEFRGGRGEPGGMDRAPLRCARGAARDRESAHPARCRPPGPDPRRAVRK